MSEVEINVSYGRTVQPVRFESLRGDIGVRVNANIFLKKGGVETELDMSPEELQRLAVHIYDQLRMTLWEKLEEEGTVVPDAIFELRKQMNPEL